MTEFLIRNIDSFEPHRRKGLNPKEERALALDEWTKEKLAKQAFADINGWILQGSHCHPEMLGKRNRMPYHYSSLPSVYDHIIGYRRDGLNIAIVTQPYSFDDKERIMLTRNGLELHIPPDPKASFHYPGRTFFIVVTKPGVTVNWLPEQDGRMAGKWLSLESTK